jgi:plasmid stability protein
MRTTLTLDDDLAIALDRRRREHGHSFKEEVNELLRIGLLSVEQKRPAPPGLRVAPWDGGKSLLGNIDNVAEVLAIVEGDDYR